MIKVGILGGDTRTGGELLRLLVLHPEVEIVNVCAPNLRGKVISEYHRGTAGDLDLRFSDTVDLEELDVVFLTSDTLNLPLKVPERLKVIIIKEGNHPNPNPLPESIVFVPGVSEMFRKPLVRSAQGSIILPSPTTVSLIPLFPLALNLLLNNSISISVSLPKYYNGESNEKVLKSEIERLMNQVQLSFNSFNSFQVNQSDLFRTIIVDIEFSSGVTKEELERIYNEIYDDHNFTFTINHEPSPSEVVGTQKCLLHISRQEGNNMKIRAAADSFMRGGCGDAVHVMNLLFGLHEKTGLTFPAFLASMPYDNPS